jgi:hypothetical protein
MIAVMIIMLVYGIISFFAGGYVGYQYRKDVENQETNAKEAL